MIIEDLHAVVLVHHAMQEPILLVQTIHLLQDKGDIPDTPGQSHQGTQGIGGDHTLGPLIVDHLMHQEAQVEGGVTAGALVLGTPGDLT